MKRRRFLSNALTVGGASALIPTTQIYQSVNSLLNQSSDEKIFDVIVLGVGSMGSSACYYLAKEGHSVLGLEQFDIPHDLGSHSGQSRIIRKAYFEHPSYVPLLDKAYKNWKDLEQVTSSKIYFDTGLAYFGPKDHLLIKGSLDSASKYDIKMNQMSALEQKKSLPQFNIPENYTNMLEVDAGFVTPERAILTYVEQALKHGASIHTKEKVIDWKSNEGEITVRTNSQTYRCKKLVITTGAWTSKLTSIDNLQVRRQTVAWAQPKNWEEFALGNFPCWTYANPSVRGIYYGFPVLPSTTFGSPIGLKFAHHTPGKLSDPDMVHRNISKQEEADLVKAIRQFIPEGIESIHTIKSCLYTYSPDENFIIDFYEENKNVVLAAGFSGHGFKFASVVGEILSDLAMTGETTQPIDFLKTKRLD